MKFHLRVARPVTDLARSERMYRAALDLEVLARFEDHTGFDGVMLGRPGREYHFEFTYCHTHPVTPSPTADDLLVLYEPDATQWAALCAKFEQAGFVRVASFNPWWDESGQTYQDPDGYRTVLKNGSWPR
jgi:catechol 2,3-dioxygenase-like lactoylglutathione lyase family enzyme